MVKYVKGSLREISLLITAILRMITQIFLYFNSNLGKPLVLPVRLEKV